MNEQGNTEQKQRESQVDEELLRITEAAIFASSEIIPAQKLRKILPDSPSLKVIREIVALINQRLQTQQHPFEIVEVAGGFQFRTISAYAHWVQRLNESKNVKRLSPQALECLSIVAYRQPVTKAQIDALRGSSSDGSMKTLLEKRLITISGRSDKPGNPLLYATTNHFLSYFGLTSLKDLPKIEEFEAIAKKKTEQLLQEEESDTAKD
jgi:segregation and condensation protein B